MLCEPNLLVPQKVDLKSLRDSSQPKPKKEDDSKVDYPKPKISYLAENYRTFPKFTNQFDHLSEVLSLRSNDYLACRWDKFLNRVPDEYVRICLFTDIKKQENKPEPKRMRLTGKFYGVDSKLAPVPMDMSRDSSFISRSPPQKINLESLRDSNKFETAKNKNQNDDNMRPKISYRSYDYYIFPKFTDQFNHLNKYLSLRGNKYLACRWNQFLDNTPDDYVYIRSYADYLDSLKMKGLARRKTLNGRFYGIDNKLAPIPVVPNPRRKTIKMTASHPRQG
ncbi:hypothetical protein GQX74_010836 [Glossina fuscipes]|nr:hypothetical protein GQX74_010836 [Glossina fuscipes]